MNFSFISQRLHSLEHQNLLRKHCVIDGPPGVSIVVDGIPYLNFASNDYLGLSQHPAIVKAFQNGLEEYGTGSTASAVVTGFSRAHLILEQAICEWLNCEEVLLFNSGFAANSALITALLGKGDYLCMDKLAHASLIDAGINCAAEFQRFNHNNIEHLNARLLSAQAENKLLVTEGVFSMDGDQAPLQSIADIATEHQAWLMVDDAHGIGVLGKTGAGSLEAQHISSEQCQILMATFGKALGVAGAFVAGNKELIEFLTNFARQHIYSTAFPPAQAVAITKAIEIAQQENWRREKLAENINQFKQAMQQLGLPLSQSDTAIQPVIIGDIDKTLAISDSLKRVGIWVTAIRPPTVPAGTSRLRITLSAAHSENDINLLISALENVIG